MVCASLEVRNACFWYWEKEIHRNRIPATTWSGDYNIHSGGPENHPCVHYILTLQVHKCFFTLSQIEPLPILWMLIVQCTFYNAHCALHKYMRKRSNVVLYGEVHGVDHSAVHRNVLINVVKMNSILFQIFWEEKWALLVCQILLDPFVLRCAVVIFRQDGLAREGECVFCPCGYQSRRWRFGFGTRGVGRGSEWRGEGGEVKVLLGKWGWGHEDGQ